MLFDVLDVVVTWWRAGGRTCCRRISAQDFCGIPLCLRMVRTSFFYGKNVILSVEEKLLMDVIIGGGGCTVRFDTTPMVRWGRWRLLKIDLYCEMREPPLHARVLACHRRERGRMLADTHTFASSSPALVSLDGQSSASRSMIMLGIPPMPEVRAGCRQLCYDILDGGLHSDKSLIGQPKIFQPRRHYWCCCPNWGGGLLEHFQHA